METKNLDLLSKLKELNVLLECSYNEFLEKNIKVFDCEEDAQNYYDNWNNTPGAYEMDKIFGDIDFVDGKIKSLKNDIKFVFDNAKRSEWELLNKDLLTERMNLQNELNSEDIELNSFNVLFSVDEQDEYMYLMTLVNCSDFGDCICDDTITNNERLAQLDALFEERAQNWHSENYFVKKCERTDMNQPWVLYASENGLAVDIEDTFARASSAVEYGLHLETKFRNDRT